MVKKVNQEQMSLAIEDGAAKALADEVSYGQGSPVEARIAAAIMENAANIRREAALFEKCYAKMDQQCKAADRACSKAAEMIKAAEGLSSQLEILGEEVEEAAALGQKACDHSAKLESQVASAVVLEVNQDLSHLKSDIKAVAASAKAAEGEVAELAASATAAAEDFRSALPTKKLMAGLALAMSANLIVVAMLLSTFAPIVQGKVTVEYSQDYQGELETAREELAEVSSELEAYKDAYGKAAPTAASEKRLLQYQESKEKKK